MNPEFITRVVGLVQKNGDRVILADPQTGKAVVVLDLESYERLCDTSAVAAATPPVAPVKTQENTLKIAQKTAEPSKNTTSKRQPVFLAPEASEKASMRDLTQEELLDKINRDIGVWKTAQERKHAEELVSAAQTLPRFSAIGGPAAGGETQNALEEEERFYLEPIE
jgi:hypothetical protein